MSSIGCFENKHIERLYFSNTLRATVIAAVRQTDGKFPWENEIVTTSLPELACFLSNLDAEYGKTEADYANLLGQFSIYCRNEKWLFNAVNDALDRDKKNYFPCRKLEISKVGMYLFLLGSGVILGWLA